MGLPKGTNNGACGKKGRSGRKGYHIENAKKYLLDQAFYIAIKSLEKDNSTPIEEKRKIALEIIKKELGKNIDITTGGKTINKVLVKFIDGKDN